MENMEGGSIRIHEQEWITLEVGITNVHHPDAIIEHLHVGMILSQVAVRIRKITPRLRTESPTYLDIEAEENPSQC